MFPRLACIIICSSLLVACGDDDEVIPDAAPIVDAPTGGADAALIDAALIDASTADAQVTDSAVTDAPVATPDAPVTPDAMACSTSCPTENGSTSANAINTGGIIIQSINFATSRVVLKNVTAGDKTISNWVLCFGPPTYLNIPDATVVPDGGTLTLVVGSGPCGGMQPGEVCVSGGFTIPNTGELGLYIDTDYAMPASIRTYVRWGALDGTTSSVRQMVADQADLWPGTSAANDFVPICGTHDGFVATGDVTSALGYASADVTCF